MWTYGSLQVVGQDRVKRGAYLAGLADGPSVAQDLGLSPKDRLIAVEGLEVQTLPFDRIGETKEEDSMRRHAQ